MGVRLAHLGQGHALATSYITADETANGLRVCEATVSTTAVNKVSLRIAKKSPPLSMLNTNSVSYFTLGFVSVVLPLSSCFVHGRGLLQCYTEPASRSANKKGQIEPI